jgi:multidrug resistance efflux pump
VLRFLDHRLARLTLATSIVIVLAGIAASRVLYSTSIEAVLNAPRITLVAPRDGVVDSLAVVAGQSVAPGQPLLQLRRTPWSSGIGDERDARAFVLTRRAEALAAEVRTLEALRDSLGVRLRTFRLATIERLAADTLATAARAIERGRQFARVEQLRQVDGTTDVDVDRLRAEVATARAEHERAVAAARAAQLGVVVDPGGQDAPYSRQRLDELHLRLAELRAEQTMIRAELATMGGSALASGERATTDLDAVLVRASAHGVVWSVSTSPGESVLRGAPLITLIDCSRLFFEATIGPREQDHILPGMPVQVRFAGTSTKLPAQVAFVRGGGLRESDEGAAQLQFDRRRTDARVVIDVTAEAVGAAPGNFCQVGRSAKVIFDGPTVPWTAGDAPAERAPPAHPVDASRPS